MHVIISEIDGHNTRVWCLWVISNCVRPDTYQSPHVIKFVSFSFVSNSGHLIINVIFIIAGSDILVRKTININTFRPSTVTIHKMPHCTHMWLCWRYQIVTLAAQPRRQWNTTTMQESE